jgi:hypothetical protein
MGALFGAPCSDYFIIGLQQKGLIDLLQSIRPRNCKTIKKKKNTWQF